MEEKWRYNTVSITKYNPVFRNEHGLYTRNEWLGFSQIGQVFDEGKLTLDSYLEVERKYILAAILFFEFHNCKKILVKNIEKYDYSDYKLVDQEKLLFSYHELTDGSVIDLNNLENIVQLVLRELIWAELFCFGHEDIALRFGYDFYMYFNSNKDLKSLFERIKALGLYIY